MHERCGAPSWPAARISSTVSSVPSRVEPPAPKVQEKKRGLSFASSCQVARSFALPSAVFGGKNSKLNALASIDEGPERGVHGAIHWRLEPGLRAHARDRAAQPWRFQPVAGLEVVQERWAHLVRQRLRECELLLDEVFRQLYAARAPEAPGLAHRLLERPAQLRVAAHHAKRRARHRACAGEG